MRRFVIWMLIGTLLFWQVPLTASAAELIPPTPVITAPAEAAVIPTPSTGEFCRGINKNQAETPGFLTARWENPSNHPAYNHMVLFEVDVYRDSSASGQAPVYSNHNPWDDPYYYYNCVDIPREKLTPGNYELRVVLVTDDGNRRSAPAFRRFTYGSPNEPVVLPRPAHQQGSVSDPVILSWQTQGNRTVTGVRFGLDPAAATLVPIGPTNQGWRRINVSTNIEYAWSAQGLQLRWLIPNATYFWQVETTGGAGPIWSFSTGSTIQGPPTSPAITVTAIESATNQAGPFSQVSSEHPIRYFDSLMFDASPATGPTMFIRVLFTNSGPQAAHVTVSVDRLGMTIRTPEYPPNRLDQTYVLLDIPPNDSRMALIRIANDDLVRIYGRKTRGLIVHWKAGEAEQKQSFEIPIVSLVEVVCNGGVAEAASLVSKLNTLASLTKNVPNIPWWPSGPLTAKSLACLFLVNDKTFLLAGDITNSMLPIPRSLLEFGLSEVNESSNTVVHSVRDGQLTVANSLNPIRDWLWDLDVDRANQLRTRGTLLAGSTLTATYAWDSSSRGTMTAGIGLIGKGGTIDLFAGYVDGDSGGYGTPVTVIKRNPTSGTTRRWNVPSQGNDDWQNYGQPTQAGETTVTFQRTGSTLHIQIGGIEVTTLDLGQFGPDDPTIAIVTHNHQRFEFGTFTVKQLDLTRSSTQTTMAKTPVAASVPTPTDLLANAFVEQNEVPGPVQRTLANGTLTITNSLNPTRDWLWDLDVDRANQLRSAGRLTQGSTLTSTYTWNSSWNGVQIGGIGLIGSDGRINLFAGYVDGDSGGYGQPLTVIKRNPTDGTTRRWNVPSQGNDEWQGHGQVVQQGTANLTLRRAGSTVHVLLDGNEVTTLDLAQFGTDDPTIAIVTHNHQRFSFGEFSVKKLTLTQ